MADPWKFNCNAYEHNFFTGKRNCFVQQKKTCECECGRYGKPGKRNSIYLCFSNVSVSLVSVEDMGNQRMLSEEEAEDA
jgi:hypothetical protein